MAGGTITSVIGHSVTLGSNGYTSPLSIAVSGTIDGSATLAALYVPVAGATQSITNSGLILGTTGRRSASAKPSGADGILLSGAALVVNTGRVTGGAGVAGQAAAGQGLAADGNGGIGIDIAAAGGLVRNKGEITGGVGGGSYGYGGYGVAIAAGGKLHNNGTITGGAGNNGGVTGSGVDDVSGWLVNAGSILGGAGVAYGGSGVAISGAGAIGVNTGEIQGGNARETTPRYGGFGLLATDQAIFHNAGTIEGGRQAVGAEISGASLINRGVIQGGENYGSVSGEQGYYIDVAGVVLKSGRFVNFGTIVGGGVKAGALYNDYGGIGVEASTGFNNRGLIQGGNGGDSADAGNGGAGTVIESPGTVHNYGLIDGGNGGSGTSYSGSGGIGIRAAGSSFVNHGIVTGGAGGDGGERGGHGGYGVGLAAASLTNTGTLAGGAGGSHTGAIGGDGAKLLNQSYAFSRGAILGGAGGSASASGSAGDGGVGVYLSGGTLVNRGRIVGGAGGAAAHGNGGFGGDGVYLGGGGTLVNEGIISGGSGGSGSKSKGEAGHAVYLGAGSTLIVDPSGRFSGLVTATSDTDTLGLAGKATAPLVGIGEEFLGFGTIAFAADAIWKISGTTEGLAAKQEVTGFTSADSITLTNAAAASGTVTVATAGTVTIDAGGTIYQLDIAGAAIGEMNFSFRNHILTESTAATSPLATPAIGSAHGALFAPPPPEARSAGSAILPASPPAAGFAGALQETWRSQQPIPPGLTLHA